MTTERMKLSEDVIWLQKRMLAKIEARLASGELVMCDDYQRQIDELKRCIETGYAERENGKLKR